MVSDGKSPGFLGRRGLAAGASKERGFLVRSLSARARGRLGAGGGGLADPAAARSGRPASLARLERRAGARGGGGRDVGGAKALHFPRGAGPVGRGRAFA